MAGVERTSYKRLTASERAELDDILLSHKQNRGDRRFHYDMELTRFCGPCC